MNIIECVKRFGDVPFSETPFSEVDSLILSALSYLDFRGLVDEGGALVPLRALRGEGERLAAGSIHPREGFLLLGEVTDCARYSELKVGYFREVIDDRLPMRFAAVSFFLGDGTVYVGFRGTDVTIAAWHEDFDLLFQNTIPSQAEAVKYLSEVMAAESANFYVGGHSKGGNLAVFSAASLPETVQRRILAVYNHDGPGFYENFFETPGYLRIADRYQKTVPHDSLVGMLFRHTDRYRVVASRKTLLGQHNPYVWEAESFASFRILKRVAPISRRAERALGKWIAGMSVDERKRFVMALFRVIGASGAEKVSDLKRKKLQVYRKMWRAYRALPKEDRALVRRGGGVLMRIWLRAVRG